MLNLRIPAGIGDISWCISKLCNLNEELNLYISADNPRRSLDFVQLFPFVKQAQYDHSNFHSIVNHSLPPSLPKETLIRLSKQARQNFSLNRFLEQGNRIENFMPEIPTNLHYQIPTSEEDKKFARQVFQHAENPVGIYTSNYINIANWNGWHLEEWAMLIREIHKNIKDITFILLGAEYDREFTDDLSKIIEPIPHINLCGKTSISQVVEIIKNLKYFISYPCGLPILANVLNTPVLMFYPQHLKGLHNSWADQNSIQNKTYKGCEFAPVNIILKWLFEEYKLNQKI